MGILSLSTLIETNYIKRLLKDNKKTPQDIKMSAPNSNNNQASMIGGHAQYAKGYVEESIGNLTGSKEWQESGKKDAEAGIGEMKAANQNRTSEPAASGMGAESRSWQARQQDVRVWRRRVLREAKAS